MRSARPRCSDTAHSTASTTLPNSASMPVAHQLEDAAVVPGDFRLEQFLAPGTQPLECARLVALHERRVADDVGGKNGGKLAVHCWPGPAGLYDWLYRKETPDLTSASASPFFPRVSSTADTATFDQCRNRHIRDIRACLPEWLVWVSLSR